MHEIKIWAQMFFDDGSVTQGVRIPFETVDDDREIDQLAGDLLDSVNREEGAMCIWGGGYLEWFDVTSSSSQESDSSES